MKINAKNGFDIRFIKNNTYALLVTFKDIDKDLRSAFFTVKENPEDETPVLQKSLGAGIFKVDDRAYKNEKKYKVQIQAEDTSFLEAEVQYLYDLQVTIDNVVKTVASGLFVVSPTITGDQVITATEDIVAEVTDEIETEFETTSATAGIEYETDPVAKAIIGLLTSLKTDNKETIVKAINEVKDNITAEATARGNAITAEAKARAEADKIIRNELATGTIVPQNATNAVKTEFTNTRMIISDIATVEFTQGSWQIIMPLDVDATRYVNFGVVYFDGDHRTTATASHINYNSEDSFTTYIYTLKIDADGKASVFETTMDETGSITYNQLNNGYECLKYRKIQ